MRPGHRKERAEGSGRGVSDRILPRLPRSVVCGRKGESGARTVGSRIPSPYSMCYICHCVVQCWGQCLQSP